MRPLQDHTGHGKRGSGSNSNKIGTFYRYEYARFKVNTSRNGMASELESMALQVTVNLDDELGVLLKNDMLDCSTALREWGMKI